jgi:hypothetical protein
VGGKLWRHYTAAQIGLIVAYAFLPHQGWLHVVWQVAVDWTSAVFVVIGARQVRSEQRLPWLLIAAGIFLNSSGLLVEEILARVYNITAGPTLTDAFFLALYPPLIVSLGFVVYRRTAGQALGALLPSTVMSLVFTVGVGLFAWEFIVWQPSSGQTITFLKRAVVTAYPIADLALIAFVLRLLFGGGGRGPAITLVVIAVCALLAGDIAWAVFLRSGFEPDAGTSKLLAMAGMGAFALMGGAARFASTLVLDAPGEPGHRGSHLPAWAMLAASSLSAPAVLLVEVLLDHLYHVSGP